MTAVADAQLTECDFLLSIVPPGDALALAQRLTPVLSAANKKPILCRMQRGQPADRHQHRRGDRGDRLPLRRRRHHRPAAEARQPPTPKFYASGPDAADFARLNDYGLIVRVLQGPLTAASALKMSYAGITKGFTALGAA